MRLVVGPYFSAPEGSILSYRDMTALAGRRLPYTTNEGRHVPTEFFRPDYVEFVLVTAGEGLRRVRQADGSVREHPLLPGELYCFRPMDVHQIVPAGRSAASVVCVTFPTETWERFAIASELDQRPFTRPDAPMVEIDVDDPARLRPFRRIVKMWRRRLDTMDLIRFLSHVAPWFVEAAREEEARTAEPAGAPRWLRSAIAAMHEEENLRLGVGRLAELSHVSHTHLWRNTRTYFGLSPSEVVNEIRLHHASMLLMSTDTSIAMIAERCGFSSAGHLSTAFRRDRHMTPSAFRAETQAQSRVR